MIGLLILLLLLKPSAPRVFTNPACHDFYVNAMTEGPEGAIDVRIIFGYKDARPARFVGDIYERNALVAKVLERCKNGETDDPADDQACGFSRTADDMDVFTRSITGIDGKRTEVRLTVAASAAGPDDEENRRDPFQKWRTSYVRSRFLEGLIAANAVFYDGHARDGGGPDFSPPRMDQWRHVDYDWYKQNRLGVKEMVKTLTGASKTCSVVGLFSCASDRLFTGAVLSARPDVTLLTLRRLVYYSDALEDARQALSDLLAMRCRPDAVRKTGTQ